MNMIKVCQVQFMMKEKIDQNLYLRKNFRYPPHMRTSSSNKIYLILLLQDMNSIDV